MGSYAKHFVLGAIIGIISIVMLYVMFNTVIVEGTNTINSMNAFVVILIYGMASVLFGELLDKFFFKKKKR